MHTSRGKVALITCLLFAGVSSFSANAVAKVPKNQNRIESISELPKRYKDIKFLAWKQMKTNSQKQVRNPMPIKVLISPSVTNCSNEAIAVIRGIEGIYRKTNLPKSLTIIFADGEIDREWLTDRTSELLDMKYRSFQGDIEINPETVNGKGDGVLWAMDACRDKGKLSTEERIEIAHGFTHVIQTMQFTRRDSDWGLWGEVPRWMLEGGATLTHNFWKNRKNYDTYFKNSENLYGLSKYPKDFFEKFLKVDKTFRPLWSYTDQWDNQRAYDVGAFVCESLVAFKGPESIINLYSAYLSIGDFDRAFEEIYGMTWTDAHPYIYETIYKQIKWSSSVMR